MVIKVNTQSSNALIISSFLPSAMSFHVKLPLLLIHGLLTGKNMFNIYAIISLSNKISKVKY